MDFAVFIFQFAPWYFALMGFLPMIRKGVKKLRELGVGMVGG